MYIMTSDVFILHKGKDFQICKRNLSQALDSLLPPKHERPTFEA